MGYAVAWQRSATYPLPGSTLLTLSLGGCDALLLGKPEMIEGIVRRAPIWEQLLAWRQRAAYFSVFRRLRQGAMAMVQCVRGDTSTKEQRGTAGLLNRRIVGGWDDHSVMEMVNQANPIQPSSPMREGGEQE